MSQTIRILLLVLIFGSPRAFAESTYWPPLETDKQKIQFLLGLREHVPNIFEGPTEYEVDLFKVLQQQNDLLKNLSQNPQFQPLIFQRPNRVDIHLSPRKNIKEIQADLFNSFKGKLLDKLQQYSRETHAEENTPVHLVLEPIINKYSITYPTLTTDNLFVGLIKSLPKERQGEVFRLPVDQKLGEISKSITDESLLPALKQVGVTVSNFSEVYNSLLVRDQVLIDSFVLLAISSDSKNISELAQKIRQLDADQITNILTPKSLDSALEKAPWISYEGRKLLLSLKSESIKIYRNQLGLPAKSEALINPKENAGIELHLKETTSPVGFARGCAGNDCTMKYAAGFATSGMERTWFLYNSKNEIIGYAAGTMILVQGKKFLYLNTINGPRVTTHQALAAIESLYRFRSDLGVEGIVLPLHDRIEMNINFEQIKTAFNKLIENRPNVEISYQDMELRRQIAPYVEKTDYDSPETNRNGVIYTGNEAALIDTVASVNPADKIIIKTLEIKKGDAIMLAIEFELAHQKHNAQRILVAAGVSNDDYESVKQFLRNSNLKTSNDFLVEASRFMERYQVQVDTTFKNSKLSVFAEGLLRAPDAFKNENQQRSIKAYIQLLKKGFVTPEVESAVKPYASIIQSAPQLSTYLVSELDFTDGRGLNAVWDRFGMLKRSGISVEKIPAVREKIYELLKSSHYIGHDYFLKLGNIGVLLAAGIEPQQAIREILKLLAISQGGDPRIPEMLKFATKLYPKEAESEFQSQRLAKPVGSGNDLLRQGFEMANKAGLVPTSAVQCRLLFHSAS
jgi:Tfp pilus assembly protein PilE